MCYHQPPQTESTAFHALVIVSTFLLEHIRVCSAPKSTKEAIVSVPFFKVPFCPRTYQSHATSVTYILGISSEVV